MTTNGRTPPSPFHPRRDSAGQQPPPPIGIAVMGTTGSGKTSFINMASGSQFRVGMDLQSCTAEVQVASEFTIDGRRVVLIDTPGFDDTNVSDSDILEKIAAFLAVTYENGSKLAGIIYIHRISDERFSGISVRNFKMFRKLCGDSTLKNVVIVTNMWGKVEQGIGEARERQLADIYFKPALDKQAQLVRYHNTSQSSHDIIRRIMKNDPATLRIQEELVDEGMDIRDTAAGEAVNEELTAMMGRHKAEMGVLRTEMQQALKEKDEETKKELEEEARKLQGQMDEMRRKSEGLESNYQEERKRTEEGMRQMREQARLDRDRAHADHSTQMSQLRTELQQSQASAQAKEQARALAEERTRTLALERDRALAEERFRASSQAETLASERARAAALARDRDLAEERARASAQAEAQAKSFSQELSRAVSEAQARAAAEQSMRQKIQELEGQVSSLSRKDDDDDDCVVM